MKKSQKKISGGIILIKSDKIKNHKKDTIINIKQLTDFKNLDNFNNDNNIKFLLVKKKNTIGYSTFLLGNYNIYLSKNVYSLFDNMTCDEILKIKNLSFDELWDDYFNIENNILKKKLYKRSLKKYNDFKKLSYLDELFKNENLYNKEEWEFPKGRKNDNENLLDCALREFYEETGLKLEDINIIKEINPLTENLIGTNGKLYISTYYIAEIHEEVALKINDIQEISKVNFYTYNQCMDLLKNTLYDRKNILTSIYNYYLSEEN